MNNKFSFGKEAQEKLLSGIKKVGQAVGSTLGAKGRFVIIQDPHGGSPIVTKDGVTVARHIAFEDVIENIGATLIKEASVTTLQSVGDGPQPLYSKVLTPDGFVTMGSLKVGDKICGTNKTVQEVVGIYPKGEREIYKLKFANGQEVECCEDHLWSVVTTYNSQKTLTTKQLFEDPKLKQINKDGSAFYKYYINTTVADFNKRDFILDPYLVGLLIGDGSLSGTGSIELSLALDQYEALDDIILPEGIKYTVTADLIKHYLRVKFSKVNPHDNRPTMHDYVEQIGLLGVKSSTKFIPKDYLYSDYESRMRLLKGLEVTDGHITKRGLLEYSTTSKQLCEDVVELLRGLGKQVFYYLKDRSTDHGSYSNTSIYRIAELKGYKHGVKLIGIERTGEFTEMQCIKVSNPDHLYITNDYICTHNTSTSCILAVSMIEQGFEQIRNGMNPVDVKNGISATVDKVIENLKLSAISVKTPEQIYNVAFISANNDKEIATLIADSIKIAPKGNIIVEESGTSDSYVVEEIGCKYNQGLTNRAFINNKILNKTIYEDCAIIMVDGKLDNINKIAERLEELGKTNQPVVIIAEDFDNYVMKILVTNREARGARLAAIKLPGFGDFKEDYKLDIESICNYNHEDGLGWVKKIIVSDESTTFVPYEASMQSISNRLNLLGNQNKNADNLFIKQTLDDRINALIGQTAIIYIGGNSETEVKEKQDRVDDSLKAVKAAIEEGVVAGGGIALLNQAKDINQIAGLPVGEQIVLNALSVPFRTLLENAGLDINDYIKKVSTNYGVNILTGEMVHMFEVGIIDPLKVTRIALEKAKSITELILTTNCIIHE